MFFIKRKKAEVVKEAVARIVISNQDKIVLGAFCFTGMQKGDFFVKETATIATTAIVEGNVTAMDCDIHGLIKGNVFCANNLWLSSSAVIEGSIMAKNAILETGCRVNGQAIFAPKVEVLALATKIIEAEKIIVEEGTPINQDVIAKKIEIPQKHHSMPDIKVVVEEQKKINVQKPESNIAQSVDNNNWW